MIGLAMMLAVSAMQPITSPPARAGQCRWVRGRYRIYNGSSIRRVWIIGTTRIVAMRDDDPHEPPMIRKHGVPGNSLYGQFLICAVSDHGPAKCSMSASQRPTTSLSFATGTWVSQDKLQRTDWKAADCGPYCWRSFHADCG